MACNYFTIHSVLLQWMIHLFIKCEDSGELVADGHFTIYAVLLYMKPDQIEKTLPF
jgi:hypothetical protein